MKKLFLLIVVILIGRMTYAQQGEIYYTDFDPDSTQTFHNYIPPDPSLYLDVDHDGVNDWMFESGFAFYHCLNLAFCPTLYIGDPDWPLYKTTFTSDSLEAVPLQEGDTLRNLPNYYSPAYFNYPYNYYSDPPGSGYFPPHFIAVRHEVEGGYCYGWLEASVNIHDGGEIIDATVFRMAFCTIPNYPFLVGQTSFDWNVGVDETHQRFLVHPNPTKGQFSVSGAGMTKVEVYNLQGERLMERHCADETTIDLGKQPSGMYLITVTDDQGKQHTQKIIKQ